MRLLFVLFIAISSFVGYTQSDNQILMFSEADENNRVSEIRGLFNQINTDKVQYELVTQSFDGYSAGGGELKAYYHQKKLKKATVTYFGETGKAVIDYYFDKGIVFFIFRQDSQYNSPIYITESNAEMGVEAFDSNKTKIVENRYYFSGDKLIRWLNEKKEKKIRTSPEFLDKQKELISDIAFIKSKL